MNVKCAMVSQPMAGKTDEEIALTRERAINALKGRGYKVVNTLFTDDDRFSENSMRQRSVVQIPLNFLAESLERMSLCHAVYFCKGWENARGCRIEHEAAEAYGLEIIYEEDEATGDPEEAARVTIEYADGHVEDPQKCCIFRFRDVEGNPNRMFVTMEMLNIKVPDLHIIVDAALHLGQKLGMFGSLEDDDD